MRERFRRETDRYKPRFESDGFEQRGQKRHLVVAVAGAIFQRLQRGLDCFDVPNVARIADVRNDEIINCGDFLSPILLTNGPENF